MSDTNQLFPALVKAQAEIKQPKKNAVNPHFKSKFADLTDCFDAVREPLNRNGLVITQIMALDNGIPVLITRLNHVSGEFLHSIVPLPVDATPQQMGSALTYLKRYSLCAMLCLVGDAADDDGEAATGAGKPGGFVSKASAKTAAQESFKVAAAKATTLEGLEKAKAAVAGMDGDEAIAKAYAEAKARLTSK